MTNLEKIYYINIGEGGTFKKSGDYDSSPSDVEHLFEYLEENDVERLLVYFHGGLVSETSGMGSAEVMRASFADTPSKTHAVTFVWETGLWETIVENLSSKSTEGQFQKVLNFVIKLVGKKLGIDSRGGGETLDNATIETEKLKEYPFAEQNTELNSKGGNITFDEEDEMFFLAKLKNESDAMIRAEGELESKEIEVAAPDPDSGDSRGLLLTLGTLVAKIAFEVLKRYAKDTHHDFYPTVVEETFRKLYIDRIGKWGWSEMKEKAGQMFAGNEGLSGDDLHAGTYFLTLLEAHSQKRQTAGKKFTIELVGHSAGSIAICNMLAATSENFRQLKYNNVVFLAPACRTDLFIEKGIPAKENGVFKKFKMFTMQEQYEKKDYCVKYLYTYSLLYLVSGLFEDETDAKIMGLHEQFKAEGRYAKFEELNVINSFITSNKLALSKDIENADNSMWTDSLRHGDFDNNTATLKSILSTINIV
ncbi:hypothetical protein D0817_00415 [Flavobacterium cupreum]|uniref:Alpha/beta hydrolase n=4 Tax=Flavobacterium TaxID=237 RepID=A0A434ACL9_9FLAO|nr:hypothetical protein [Flavobacterium cupreum]RUT72121.1 hypothetical protein D0817_00415 [Flavobacterium cupreum]